MPLGHIPRSSGNGDNFAVGSEYRNEDVIVDTAAERPGKRHFAANRLARRNHLINFLIVLCCMPSWIPEFEKSLADRILPRLAPHL